MRFLFSFLCLFSMAAFAAPTPLLTLEEKIHALEKKLEDMRQQNHLEKRVEGDKERELGTLKSVDPQSNTPKAPSAAYELYEQGRHYLAQQRLDLAREIFNEVVETQEYTPESILARFWIGEFMIRSKNYSGASIALGQAYGALKKAQRQKGFSQEAFHGEEDRLPEILAKLAYALKMINKRQDACITLRQLKKDYKKRSENLQWYINKLSKELRCR